MKSVIAIVFLLIFLVPAYSQKRKKPKKVMWYDWYDSAAFFQGPKPLIVGIGPHTDSLSKSSGGIIVFEHDRLYYRVNCLADYYFWFTRKYSYLFRESVDVYEQIYFSGDSFGLAHFIHKNYKGKKLPVKFRFPHDPTIPLEPPPKKDPDRPVTIPKPRYLTDY